MESSRFDASAHQRPPVMRHLTVNSTARERSASTSEIDDAKSSVYRRRTPSTCEALQQALLTLFRIDDFKMEHLGNGFFSDVYKVVHKVTDKVMVLKMNTMDDNRSNVLREVQLMNKMAHPNILKFLGVCVHQGQLHALSEFINGGSLHDLLADASQEISWGERVKLSFDIASGMKYLHSEGVFHRDLTSNNVLIKIDGAVRTAVVGDFGLATKIPDKNAEFRLSTVGTPYWMSPECIRGERYDERADIFSFGIILCEIIARIDADPDIMPRTSNFGLDYIAFSELTPDCPLHYLYLAFRCCQMDPARRPNFPEIVDALYNIKQRKLLGPHPNPIAAKSNIVAGHVHRHIRRFSRDGAILKRSFSAGENLDFLQTAAKAPLLPTPQFIGEHMTQEDPFYKPASISINPFQNSDTLREGRKIIAADKEEADASVNIPIQAGMILSQSGKHLSLPSNCSEVDIGKRVEQLNKVSVACKEAREKLKPLEWTLDFDDETSVDSAVDMASQISGAAPSSTLDATVGDHQNPLNLECAMIFQGLDMIRLPNSFDDDTRSDLESEFQDGLEDVLRSETSSEPPLTVDDIEPPTTYVSLRDEDRQWWNTVDHSDPSARYYHPTLIEKRRSLRRVEPRNKLEQLQIKLDKLRQETSKKKKSSTK